MKNKAKQEIDGRFLTVEEICDLVNSKLRPSKPMKPTSCSRYVTLLRFQFLEQFIRKLYDNAATDFPFSANALRSSGG